LPLDSELPEDCEEPEPDEEISSFSLTCEPWRLEPPEGLADLLLLLPLRLLDPEPDFFLALAFFFMI
jgi:hypothetical protein